jgi:hypothetical protein
MEHRQNEYSIALNETFRGLYKALRADWLSVHGFGLHPSDPAEHRKCGGGLDKN